MNADMLKAIVAYMALMIPFCFFLQKLLFKFTRLEHELLAFVALFSATYIGLRLIHPAFAIAMNPEAIFIAFSLGAIGCFVTWMLHARFEAEMTLLFRTYTGIAPEVKYLTVGQTAVLIGVTNMKRRRARTLLTTGTVVLVTFTLLAFSSISRKMKPTIVARGHNSPYTGLFYRWPGGAPMDEATLTTLKTLFCDGGTVIVRRVLLPQKTAQKMPTTWTLEGTNLSNRSVELQGIIGLPMEDQELLGPLPLMHGRFFSSPTAQEAILPMSVAEAMGIRPEQVGRVQLRLLGEELTLVGLLNDERYRLMRDLDNSLPLIPMKPLLSMAAPSASQENLDVPQEDLSASVMDTSTLAFLPAELARQRGGLPFTISIRFSTRENRENPVNLWEKVDRLLTTTQCRFYVGSQTAFRIGTEAGRDLRQGIYYVGSSYRTSIGGMERLFIPLLIAGSLLLNAMLGTVYERKSEIAVYNAVGLNPTHIFLFFLAEALVYGVIGSVSGYLIGQILTLGLKAYNLVPDININFSSLMVVYVIMFTIGLLLLSTLYPASLATRIAVPSGKRRWAMPEHDGRRMVVVFPFIYRPELAAGVMYYLYDFFSAYTEKSMAEQVAQLQHATHGTDPQGRRTFALQYAVALAPFDLGVTQSVEFVAAFDETVGSYRVQMTLTRVSGQNTDWATTNVPFLERLRRRLMHWRNMDTTQHELYVRQSRTLFSGKTPCPDATETLRSEDQPHPTE
jgi:hypothetical protein